MASTRRLAAILAADIVGYSRLMGLDEAGTAQALREHCAAADPIIAEHGGRVFKTTGDGLLIEFESVVGAVECALTLQHLAAERNAEVPSERQMEWRIGVHLGDALIEGEDILGDGVNIAARLEGIAEPGGICISEDAFRQVRGKVEAEFVDLGEQTLKNIVRPLRVYSVGSSPTAKQPITAPTVLAAILAVDLVAHNTPTVRYTFGRRRRLMAADEEGKRSRIRDSGQFASRKITEHRGHIITTMGDGRFAESASVGDAVRCAVEVQRGMAERNISEPHDRRIEFGMGIDVGDIIIEDGIAFGEVIDLAARLAARAGPGEIWASHLVRDQVQDGLDYTFVDLGQQSVDGSLRVYSISLEAPQTGEEDMPTYEGAQLHITFDTDDHTARGVVATLMNLNSVYETLVYLLQFIESDPETSTFEIPAGVIVSEDKPIAQADLLDLVYIQPGSLAVIIGAITVAGTRALQILFELLDPKLREARRAAATAKAGLAQGTAIAKAIKNIKDLEKVQDPMVKAAIRDQILRGIGALPPNSDPPIYTAKPVAMPSASA